jgi:3-(3-hydroxy-phenyl)propionate hydroxylase
MDQACVVVGAGPVGLTAALALRRSGVPVVVLESEPEGRPRPGSRAIGLFLTTLLRYERMLPGPGERIGAAGVEVLGYDTYYEGRRVFRVRQRGHRPLRSLGRSLPQAVTEGLLMKEAVAYGVEFRWGAPVAGLSTDPGGVRIELASGERIETPYVIGADGARSVVRRDIGARMEGHTDDTPFIIVDVDEHPDGSTPGLPGYFHYRAPDLGGRSVMHMPFAGGMRIDLQCLPGDDVEHLAGQDGLRQWIREVVDPWYAEHVQWVSTYRFHQVVADSYTDRHHRVLLAGEAAHLFAPWGGRGLNSGVMDSCDAAAAVVAALRSDDPAQPIRRCAEQRRAWGRHNRDISSRGLRILRGTTPAMRVARPLAARLAPAVWPAGAWLANGPLKVPVPRPRRGSWNLY